MLTVDDFSLSNYGVRSIDLFRDTGDLDLVGEAASAFFWTVLLFWSIGSNFGILGIPCMVCSDLWGVILTT